MNINVREFDSIMRVVDTAVSIYSKITFYLTLSINDLVEMVGFNVTIPSWLGGDFTPLAFMVGVGLPVYIAYQFIIWVGNSIT